MKGIVYRSAALALALVVVCSALAVPSFATDYQSTYNFWNWAYDNSWFLGKAIIGFSAGNVCQVSEDGLHHATTHSGGGGSVDGQRVYNCVCDYCGQEFQAVATDLKQSYDTIQDQNFYSGVDSTGVIVGNLKWELVEQGQSVDTWTQRTTDFWKYPDAEFYWHVKRSSNSTTKTSSMPYLKYRAYFTFDYPVYLVPVKNGIYYIGNSDTESSKYKVTRNGGTTNLNNNVNVRYECESNTEYYLDALIQPALGWASTDYSMSDTVWFSLPEYQFVAYTGYTHYVDNSRPSTFSPSFSYEDESGNVHVSVQDIFDELDLTYYNPVTNTTTNITNWTYDYSDRSYTCTTENNTTTTITYGDEYITINEGDNITYNIYYSDPQGSGDGSDGSGSGGSDDGDGIGGGLGELLGSLLGGLIDLITGLISGLIDSLINLVEMTIEKLGQVVNLFGEFGDALKVLWSWLPDEVVTILAAGVSVVVFASVIKLFV